MRVLTFGACVVLGVVVLGACDGGAAVDAGPRGTDAGSPMDAALEADAGGATDAGALAPPLELLGSWGGYGTEPGQFIEPSSVELDSLGFVYVAGHEDRFQKFTANGELVAIYGAPGMDDGQFNHPHGLAIDRRRGDLIYVGDQENHRLQVFLADGTFVRSWGDAMFQHIHDVGIDPATGDLFVGDYELDRLRRFDSAGGLLATLGDTGRGPNEFNGIWGVSTDSRGYVYVADTFNRRVQVLDNDGWSTALWTDFEGEPFVKPTGLFVDAMDRVYLCDSLADTVYVFTNEGEPLERWHLTPIVGEVSEPEDIVLDPEGVHMWIGEVRQHTVLHLRRTGR